MFNRSLILGLILTAGAGIVAERTAQACAANELSFNGFCYYLDGTGGVCNFGGSRRSNQEMANLLGALGAGAWDGLNYRSTVSINCCVWTSDATEQYGMVNHCNSNGPFTGNEPIVGGAGCNGAMQFAMGSPGQLTFCGYASAAPQIVVAPASFNFGNQRVGTTSGNQAFTVTNTGNANLTINSFSKTGPYNVIGFNLPITLGPGANTSFNISFSPTAAGAQNGSVTINSNAANNPALTVPLMGAGIVSTLTLNPLMVNFGNQAVNTVSAASNVSITNTGLAPLNITGSVVTGPFQVAGLNNGQIAPNGMITFTVKFAPTAIGNAAGNVKITSDDPNSPATLTLSGVGVGSQIAAAPNPVQFGTQPIGGAPVSLNVALTDTGNGPLNITALAIGGANAGDFTITVKPGLPAVVQPNSSTSVTVQFSPQGHGNRAGTLVVTSDALNNNTFSVPLTGVGSGPQITASPNPVNFGSANVNTAVTQALTITNSGEVNLQVMSYSFAGPNGGDFTSNAMVPFTLVPNGSMPIVITMKASAAGMRAGTIVIASNDPITPADSVDLVGVGTAPMIGLNPMMVAFGGQLVNTTSPTTNITVTNTGTGPLTISNVALGGPDAAQFNVTVGQLPATLQPNQTQQWPLTFAPQAVGMFNATLTFISDDPMNMKAVVPITGQGTSPMISVAPMTLDFGGQLVGRASQPHTATITNTGTANLTLNQVLVSGPQANAFAQQMAPMLPLTIQPMQNQPITLVFTPSAMGADTATLVIQSDDPNTPQVKVKLAGMGVSTLLTASPMTVDFGAVKAPGSGTTQMVTLTNSGGDPLKLADATVTGMTATAFTVGSAAGQLMPGATKMVSVDFSASAAGDYAATATFAATDNTVPPATVMLTAKGVSSLIVAMPSTLDFGTVEVGAASSPQAVKVTNQGSMPVKLMAVVADDPSFVVAGVDTSGSIAAGATSMFNVSFAPTSAGSKTGKISITLVGGMGPEATVMATGVGKPPTPDMGGGGAQSGGCSCAIGERGRATPFALALFVLAAVWVVRRRFR